MKILRTLFDLREPARYKRAAGEAIEEGGAVKASGAMAGYAVGTHQ
jgi:hypothetical protein